MSYTKRYTATQGAWGLVISGQVKGFIQLEDEGPVLVHVGASAPIVTSEDAVVMDAEGLMELTFDGLEATDKVYIRSRHDENNVVVAMAPGTAPA